MEKAAATATKDNDEIEIIERIFLGNIKLEDFLQKKVALILEKYK
jgi:hypothetical protein